MSKSLSKAFVDLGLQLVNEEIENALAVYGDELYSGLFAQPDVRQRLVDYVMAAIPEVYTQANPTANGSVPTKIPYHSLELRLRVETYAHWGIEYILHTQSDWHPPSSLPNAQFYTLPWNSTHLFAPALS